MSGFAVLALLTCAVGFLGFGGVSVRCFIGQYKQIGFGIFCGIVGLFYGFVLALVIHSLVVS